METTTLEISEINLIVLHDIFNDYQPTELQLKLWKQFSQLNFLLVDDQSYWVEQIKKEPILNFLPNHRVILEKDFQNTSESGGIDVLITDHDMPIFNGKGIIKFCRVDNPTALCAYYTAIDDNEIELSVCDTYGKKDHGLSNVIREIFSIFLKRNEQRKNEIDVTETLINAVVQDLLQITPSDFKFTFLDGTSYSIDRMIEEVRNPLSPIGQQHIAAWIKGMQVLNS